MKLSKKFQIRLSEKFYEELKIKAAGLNTSMANLVRLGIDSAIKTNWRVKES